MTQELDFTYICFVIIYINNNKHKFTYCAHTQFSKNFPTYTYIEKRNFFFYFQAKYVDIIFLYNSTHAHTLTVNF